MARSTFFIRLFILFTWVCLISGMLYLTAFKKAPHKEEKTLHLYVWPETFMPEIIRDFEKETGIHIKQHFYSSNEELLLTLKANGGEGYDLIIPSDYATQLLIKENLLAPLDYSQLDFVQNLNSALLNLSYDPENIYALPIEWEIYGFGVDKEYFAKHQLQVNWNTFFSPEHFPIKLGMVNDPIEAFNFASHYLFGNQDSLDESKVRKIRDLLEKQKEDVEAYAGVRADYLLATKNCHMALTSSSYIFRSSKQYPHIQFVIPEDWTLVTIENVCIPKASTKQELVYPFLNYIYQPEIQAKNTSYYHTFPVRTDTPSYLGDIPPDFLNLISGRTEMPHHFYFVEHLIPEKTIRQIWVDVKS